MQKKFTTTSTSHHWMKDVAGLRTFSGFEYEFHFRHCRHVQRQEYLYITCMNSHISTRYVSLLFPPTGVHFSLKLKETSNPSRSRIKICSGDWRPSFEVLPYTPGSISRFQYRRCHGNGKPLCSSERCSPLSLRLKIEGEKFIVRFQTLHMTKSARINTVLSKYDDVSVPGFCLLTDGDSIYPPFLFPNRLNSKRRLS
jgi:hypothetical protein